MPDLVEARARMVERQMRRRDIRDERVLDAVGRVEQYDASAWFDRTGPVAPLSAASRPGPNETYPSGL